MQWSVIVGRELPLFCAKTCSEHLSAVQHVVERGAGMNPRHWLLHVFLYITWLHETFSKDPAENPSVDDHERLKRTTLDTPCASGLLCCSWIWKHSNLGRIARNIIFMNMHILIYFMPLLKKCAIIRRNCTGRDNIYIYLTLCGALVCKWHSTCHCLMTHDQEIW